MADRKVNINNALCFLFSRIHRSDVNVTMKAIEGFYTAVEVTAARTMLLEDALALKIEMPRKLPNRRAGDGRVQREIDDIREIISVVDEAMSLFKLPRYVSDNPEKMPSLLLTEGDLRAIMDRIDKIEVKLDKLMGVHLAILSGVQHSKPANTAAGNKGASSRPPTRGTTGQAGPTAAAAAAVVASTGVQQLPVAPVAPGLQSLGARPKTFNNKPVSFDDPLAYNWGDHVMAQFSTDDQLDSEPYQPVLSRSEKKKLRAKRRRMRSSENALGELYTTDDTDGEDVSAAHVAAAMNYAAAAAKPKPKPNRKAARLLIGAKTETTLTGSLLGAQSQDRLTARVAAAKPYLGKSVFCIDNVGTNVYADEMTKFVEAMGVRVVSCYKVNPRRPQWQRRRGIKVEDRHTFRLCVPRDDCSKLLHAENWPEYMSVARWIFPKNPRPYVPSSEDQPAGTDASDVNGAVGDSIAAVTEPAAGAVDVSGSAPALGSVNPPADHEQLEDDVVQSNDMNTTMDYYHGDAA